VLYNFTSSRQIFSKYAVLQLLSGVRFPPVSLNNRVVMFVDEHHIASFGGSELRSIKWEPRNVVLALDKPWERENLKSAYTSAYLINYCSVVTGADGIIRMYYRCGTYEYCVTESHDYGLHFAKPNMSQKMLKGLRTNVLNFDNKKTQIVSVFYDKNPSVPKSEVYKAVVAIPDHTWWWVYGSPDGIHFSNISKHGVVFDFHKMVTAGSSPDRRILYGMDSISSMLWDTMGQHYDVFFRAVSSWDHRTVVTLTSPNPVKWNLEGMYRFIDIVPSYIAHNEEWNVHPEGFYTVFPQYCPTQYCSSLLLSTVTRYNSDQINNNDKCFGSNLTSGSHCELGLTDVGMIFSRGHIPKNNWDARMVWTRPTRYGSSILDFSRLEEANRQIKRANATGHERNDLWGKRRTWAVGGITNNPDTNEFQMYVVHNSWLRDVYVRRYTTPYYRLGRLQCASSQCLAWTKPFVYDLSVNNESDHHSTSFMLNYRTESIFGNVAVKLDPVGSVDRSYRNLFAEYDFNNMDSLYGDSVGRTVTWQKTRNYWEDPKNRPTPLTFRDLVERARSIKYKTLRFRVGFQFTDASIFSFALSNNILEEDDQDLGPCYKADTNWKGNRDQSRC
jgi:hypothetical protein